MDALIHERCLSSSPPPAPEERYHQACLKMSSLSPAGAVNPQQWKAASFAKMADAARELTHPIYSCGNYCFSSIAVCKKKKKNKLKSSYKMLVFKAYLHFVYQSAWLFDSWTEQRWSRYVTLTFHSKTQHKIQHIVHFDRTHGFTLVGGFCSAPAPRLVGTFPVTLRAAEDAFFADWGLVVHKTTHTTQ